MVTVKPDSKIKEDDISSSPKAQEVAKAQAQNVNVDWTPEDERRAKTRFDYMVLPLLMLGFFSQQIDRGNIGPALTSGMLDDININQTIVANGQTIMYIMVVICELPSNLLLQRVGAKFWIPCQMIVWGIVAALHSEIRNQAGYYFCRAALGISEAGFIPGSIYYMSTFYTKKDFASRASFFWVGSYIGKACGGLFAAGLFRLDGQRGLHGWQWLFLVEGVVSICIGIFALVWWPRSTADSRTLIPGFRLLTRRQEHILTTRLLLDDPAKKNAQRVRIRPRDVLDAVSAWRLWVLFLFVLSLVASVACLETYNSQIVKQLGFNTIRANALSSVGVWGSLPLILTAGRVVAVTRQHDLSALVFTMPYPILTGVFRTLQSADGINIWTRYGAYQSMVAVGAAPYVLGVVWITSNARTPTQRSVFSALYVMLTNAANSFATQIFREGDKPKYLTGLITVLSLQSLACLLLMVACVVFWYANKHELGDAGLPAVTASVEVDESKGQVIVEKKFQYAL
ncbi:hypothetical protein QQX98_012566 [Neonectria punicea]|uniref:Major facilitator superfamily (MFS) profile domain-containing protein n=1 Tax=Neonectria punicea TaxID=979145 RepID=A0ABR1GIT3_9HYPO